MNESELEKKFREFLRDDVAQHRVFLESMFRRVMWAFAAISAGFGTALYFVYGNSVDNAAQRNISAFMAEEKTPEKIRMIIDEEIEVSTQSLPEVVVNLVEEAALKSVQNELEQIANKKLEEFRQLTPEDLIRRGLRGERGPEGQQGEKGQRGEVGPRGDPLSFYQVDVLRRNTTGKDESKKASFCVLTRVNANCSVRPNADSWSFSRLPKQTWYLQQIGGGYCEAYCYVVE